MDIVGRKKGLLVSLVISLIGWVVMAGASAVWIIIVGRFIAGWGASAISLICKFGPFFEFDCFVTTFFQMFFVL